MNNETNLLSSLPRSGNSTWYWLKPSSERHNNNKIAIKQEEEESSAASPISNNSARPDEIPSLPSDLVETTKRLASREPTQGGWHWHLNPDGSPVVVANFVAARRKQQQSRVKKARDEEGAWHWNLAPDGSFAVSRNTKQRKRRQNSSSNGVRQERAKRQRNSSQRAAIVCYDENSDEEYLPTSDKEDNLEFDDGNVVNTGKEDRRFHHAAWNEKFQLLVEYKNEHETTRVPRAHPVLGTWIDTQRKRYKQKKLPEYRRECLDSIGFEWKAKVYTRGGDYLVACQAAWDEKFELLDEYKKEHRTTRVPIRHPVLGKWVNTQRTRYKQGKLLKCRRERLNSVGFEWEVNFDTAWEEKFRLLDEHIKEHGATRAHPVLGNWVSQQRREYKQKILPQHRLERLNSIGFIWEVSPKTPWMDMYNQLLCYKRQHNGSTLVSQGCIENKKLAGWMSKQRKAYSMGKLSQKRIDLLKSIGFELDPYHEQWMEMHQRLVEFKNKYGTTCVSKKKDPKLGDWVFRQRKLYNNEKLSQERIDLLESIGFKWHPDYEQWMEMYQRLVEYKKKYGNTHVPHKWKKDPKLGSWVSNQRTSCKEQSRIDLLNKIGFLWDASVLLHEQWMEMYQRLVEYKKKYGNTYVPHRWKKDPKLASWVSNQRTSCKEQYRIELLNNIGFTWDATAIMIGQVPTMQIRL